MLIQTTHIQSKSHPGPKTRTGSDLAALGQRDGAVGRDDQMIQQADVHQRQRFLQVPGKGQVGSTRFGHPAGMVVRQDHRSRMMLQCRLDDFPRVYRSLRQGSGKAKPNRANQ